MIKDFRRGLRSNWTLKKVVVVIINSLMNYVIIDIKKQKYNWAWITWSFMWPSKMSEFAKILILQTFKREGMRPCLFLEFLKWDY